MLNSRPQKTSGIPLEPTNNELGPSFQKKTRASIERENAKSFPRRSYSSQGYDVQDFDKDRETYLSNRSKHVVENLQRFTSFLKDMPLFKDCSATFLNELTMKLSSSFYPAGHVFFNAGQLGDTLFILGHGEVDLMVDGQCVKTLENGAIFGEMAAIFDHPSRRAVTAVAKTCCDCRSIDRNELLNLLDLFHVDQDSIQQEAMRNVGELQDQFLPEVPQSSVRNSFRQRNRYSIESRSNSSEPGRSRSSSRRSAGLASVRRNSKLEPFWARRASRQPDENHGGSPRPSSEATSDQDNVMEHCKLLVVSCGKQSLIE